MEDSNVFGAARWTHPYSLLISPDGLLILGCLVQCIALSLQVPGLLQGTLWSGEGESREGREGVEGEGEGGEGRERVEREGEGGEGRERVEREGRGGGKGESRKGREGWREGRGGGKERVEREGRGWRGKGEVEGRERVEREGRGGGKGEGGEGRERVERVEREGRGGGKGEVEGRERWRGWRGREIRMEWREGRE